VFIRIGKIFLVLALVAMLGAHWALLQTVAWTTMLADNLRSGSLHDAVTRTFDGQHPCCLCKAIAAGKQSEKKAEFSFQFFRKNSSSKAVAAAAARILRLIQSQSGCPRRVGVGEMISPLTLRARLRVLATLKFKYEKQKK